MQQPHRSQRCRACVLLLVATGRTLAFWQPLRACTQAIAVRASSVYEVSSETPQPNYAETGGAVLAVENGLLTQGDADLIYDINWEVFPGERYGLVGPNGAGKSSLLAAVAGIKPLEDGKAVIKNGVRMGYLVQKGVSGSTRTVYEEASSQMDAINSAAARVSAAVAAVEAASENGAALDALLKAQAAFEAVGGNTQQKQVAQVLNGLGFSTADQERRCNEFSGGWQMRISLARLLLSDSDLLLLDEPTNHLDMSAKAWLGGYLGRYEGTVLVVSHDEGLLQGMSLTGVAEVRAGRLEVYKGCSYARFREERVERAARAAALFEAEQRERARLQRFVDRFGATATKASAAQSRVKRIEKMDAAAAPPPPPLRASKARLKLAAPPPCHREMLELRGAAYGWGNVPPVLSDVSIKLEKGMRLAILGPNGAGKSTTLRAMAAELPLQAGDRVLGEGVSIGMFTQDLAQDLPQDAVAVDLVLDAARAHDASVTDEAAREVLGALGLSAAKALRRVGVLSGGEKARVALAIFALVPRNLLLLDEPSNHLDDPTLAALVDGVKRWKGTVVCVSHNRPFVESLKPTHTAVVGGGRLRFHNRPPEDCDWELDSSSSGGGGGSGSGGGTSAEAKAAERAERQEQERRRKRRVNAPARIAKIEALVESTEAKMAEIDDKLFKAGSDAWLAMELSKERQVEETKAEELYAEWEELEALLAETDE